MALSDFQYIDNIRSEIIKTDMFEFPMVYPQLGDKIEDVHTHMAHLYYMFDGQINKNVGSVPRNIYNIFRNSDAFKLFGVDERKISDIPINLHYSVLYKFDRTYIDKTVKHYLYYSNSGLGIDNHPLYESTKSEKKYKMICPKIFLFNENEKRTLFCNAVKNIINFAYTFDRESFSITYLIERIKNEAIDKIYEKIKTHFKSFGNDYQALNINFNKVLMTIKYIVETNTSIICMQNFAYALMFYIIGQNSSDISDVSFDQMLTNTPDSKYHEIISELSTCISTDRKSSEVIGLDKNQLTNLISFKDLNSSEQKHSTGPVHDIRNNQLLEIYLRAQNGSNKLIYDKIKNRASLAEPTANTQLHYLIKEIDKKLDACGKCDKTIAFRKEIFSLEYNHKYASIANNSQTAGSCTFYSIYNLMLSMHLIRFYDRLDGSNFENLAEKFVTSYLTFHYSMLLFLKKTIDRTTVKEQIRMKYIHPNGIPIIWQTINMVIDEGLVDDIDRLYGNLDSTKPNKPGENYFKMNDLCDIHINYNCRESKIKFTPTIFYYKSLEKYLVELIKNVREGHITMANMDEIWTDLTHMYANFATIFQNYPDYNPRFFETEKEICFINILALIRVYELDLESKQFMIVDTGGEMSILYVAYSNEYYKPVTDFSCINIMRRSISPAGLSKIPRFFNLLHPYEVIYISKCIHKILYSDPRKDYIRRWNIKEIVYLYTLLYTYSGENIKHLFNIYIYNHAFKNQQVDK